MSRHLRLVQEGIGRNHKGKGSSRLQDCFDPEQRREDHGVHSSHLIERIQESMQSNKSKPKENDPLIGKGDFHRHEGRSAKASDCSRKVSKEERAGEVHR